jgi:hypothetical protein
MPVSYKSGASPLNKSLTVFFIVTHARAAHNLLQVCEQVTITWRQVRTEAKCKSKYCAQTIYHR